MTIEARPANVAIDANSLIVFSGPPDVVVYWGVQGNATLEPIHNYTDSNGRAAAKLTPTGAVGETIIVTVDHGS